jgi:DNA-binding response OmpR family regulator
VELILCDWNMPGRPGLDLLEELRLDGISPIFLIVSGRGDHDSVQEAKEAGVAGYIRKPFSPDQVESRILSALHRTKAMKDL